MANAPVGNIYTAALMQHNSHPDYKYEMEGCTCSHEGINPSCGDELTLQLRIEGDVIEEASFYWQRLCGISSICRYDGRPHYRRIRKRG